MELGVSDGPEHGRMVKVFPARTSRSSPLPTIPSISAYNVQATVIRDPDRQPKEPKQGLYRRYRGALAAKKEKSMLSRWQIRAS